MPARSGSLRVPGKNVRDLCGHPLLAYSIGAAFESGVFHAVVVSTDSPQTAELARAYGAQVPELRPPDLAGPRSPDIGWVLHALRALDCGFDLFAILRPTSPFRGGRAIREAWERLVAAGDAADSIRAVRRCREHPGKMWRIDGDRLKPLLPQPSEGVPLHSRQYQDLPEVYVQTSSLELAWTRVPLGGGGISGTRILAAVTEGVEGFSIDYPDDWQRCERLAATGEAALPDPEAGRAHA